MVIKKTILIEEIRTAGMLAKDLYTTEKRLDELAAEVTVTGEGFNTKELSNDNEYSQGTGVVYTGEVRSPLLK